MNFDTIKPLKVLVSSYACGPNWGSEVGMGWNWVIHMSAYAELHVIVEKEFQADIEKELPVADLNYTPKFYYIDIGIRGRELFWKQGSFSFYSYYKKWQQAAYALSENILKTEDINIIHQLNLIGFREPGYLWKHADKYPFIWGPVGGINQIPLNYILSFTPKNLIFYLAKNTLNSLQLSYLPRVKKALDSAAVVISESSNTQLVLKNKFNIESVVIHETASNLPEISQAKQISAPLKLIWIGKIQGTKALPIALKALAEVNAEDFHLTIIGDGPDDEYCKALAVRLGVQKACTFLGKIPNKAVLQHLKNSDMLFFTSLKEGTSTVVLEALSEGIPVLCHDTCGFGDIVNEKCGIKVPLSSNTLSVKYFSEALHKISREPSILTSLSSGAVQERENLSWKENARRMFQVYKSALTKKASVLKSGIN